MNALEKYASSRARKKQRLKDALKASRKRDKTIGWLRGTTSRPIHPKTELLESKLEQLKKGRKAGEQLSRVKALKRGWGMNAITRGIANFGTLGLLKSHITVRGAKKAAKKSIKSGKESKHIATLIRKLLSKGKA
jgi:hypothetical protein